MDFDIFYNKAIVKKKTKVTALQEEFATIKSSLWVVAQEKNFNVVLDLLKLLTIVDQRLKELEK